MQLSKADALAVELVLEPEQLEQRLDCGHRGDCLQQAVRANWRAWTCRDCPAYMAVIETAADYVLRGGGFDSRLWKPRAASSAAKGR